MKKILLFSIFVFYTTNTQAQSLDFPTDVAVWRYSYHEEATQPYVPRYFYMEGDSLYNNAAYKKVSNGGLIRTEDKKVYCIPQNDTIEYLIYDFTLEIGDKFYPPPYSNYTVSDSITVIQINSILYENVLRKVWRFDNSITGWIEGIGADFGFVTDPWYEVPINESSSFECFAQDSVTIQGECSLSSSYDKSLKKIRISTFPNPFHDKITIQTDLSQPIDLIQVFDVNGRLINCIKEQSIVLPIRWTKKCNL